MKIIHSKSSVISYVGFTRFVLLCTAGMLSVTLNTIEANDQFTRKTSSFSIASNMTNRRTCREQYDHCYNDTITGDRGRRQSSNRSSPSWIDDNQFALSRCFCDDECHIYGDCCPDIKLSEIHSITKIDHLTNKTVSSEIPILTGPWRCQRFVLRDKFKRMDVSVYMNSECPSHWNDKTTENLCIRQVPTSVYDYTLDIPVVSNDTNITYANVYCAICNNDTNLVHWSISVHCPLFFKNCFKNMTEWKYIPRSYHWLHVNDSQNKTKSASITFNIEIDRQKYYETYKARRCKKDIVDHCPANWKGQKEIKLCSMYSLMVTSRLDNQTYKNKYCALCNGFPKDSKLSCPTPEEYLRFYYGTAPNHSYSMLIDFMGNGYNVGMIGNCGENQNIKCGYGEICDALQNRCRKFTCGKRFRMSSDGKCVSVPSNDGQRSEDLNDITLQNCRRVFLSLYDQFVILQNGTVYINETGKILNVSDYELFNDSVITICANTKSDIKLKFLPTQIILSTVCVFISLICLAIHILVHLVLSKLRNLPGKNLLSLSCSLFVAQFLFIFGLDIGENGLFHSCVLVGAVIHFCFLSSIFWMNIMAIDICRTFSTKSHLPCSSSSTKTYYKYSAYAWLTPLLIVTISIVNDSTSFLSTYEPRYAQPVCWINNRAALLLFFVIPLAALVVENFILFLMTVAGIRRTAKTTKVARKDSSGANSGISTERTRFILYTKLAIIMGLTWTFGFVASLAEVEFLWYFFIIFNGLQGAFIFFAFTFKRKILNLLQERFSGKKGVRSIKTDSTNRTQVTTTKSNLPLPLTSTIITQT